MSVKVPDYANGVSQLSSGLTQLNAKSKDLIDGINQLQTESSNNLDQLIAGATNLNNGLQAIQNELNNTNLPDTSQLQANLNNLMIERQKEEENMQIMKNGNNAINNDLGINEDEYLKRILGS